MRFPSGLDLIPRARCPSGIVAMTSFVDASITESDRPTSLLTNTSGYFCACAVEADMTAAKAATRNLIALLRTQRNLPDHRTCRALRASTGPRCGPHPAAPRQRVQLQLHRVVVSADDP